MAFPKNHKLSGSRTGTKNKRKLVLDEAIVKSGYSPLEFLLMVVRGEVPETTLSIQVDAAKAAAPYLHKKMPQETKLTGDEKNPVSLTIITTTRK